MPLNENELTLIKEAVRGLGWKVKSELLKSTSSEQLHHLAEILYSEKPLKGEDVGLLFTIGSRDFLLQLFLRLLGGASHA